MTRSLIISVFIILLWTQDVTCEKNPDNYIFYYWQVSWKAAVDTCAGAENTKLLCYKSKKEMDDITEAFRLSAITTANLAIWLSSRNCSKENDLEECLSLHIQKSGDKVWNYFQNNCEVSYPFICYVNITTETTTMVQSTSSNPTFSSNPTSSSNPASSSNPTSDHSIITDSSLVTITHTASSVRSPYCKKISKRGINWPDTDVGSVAKSPCPGKSTGEARWVCENKRGGTWKESGPDLTQCRSLEIKSLRERFNSSTSSDVIDELEDIFKDHDKEVFGEDLADVMLLMKALPDRMFAEMDSFPTSAKWEFTEKGINRMTSVVDNIIEMEDSWRGIHKKKKFVIGTNLLSTVEGMGSLLADSLPENINEQSIIKRNMALQVLRPKPGEYISLPQWVVTSSYSHRGRVSLEDGYDRKITNDQGNVSLVFALYNNLSSILSPTNKEQGKGEGFLNSAVVSATVTQKREAVKIDGNVRILMEHLTPYPNESACVFWNMKGYEWDTTGCYLESSNETSSICVCNHMTNFALLMDYRDVLSDIDQKPLNFITKIGCSFSIVCLAICVVIFSFYSHYSRHSWVVRYVIHRNLCLTLLIANLVLLCGLDKTANQKVCSLIAGLLHYFFLSAFSWMFLEGVHIYLLLVVVFASRKSHSEKYYLFGYGFPLLIVIITYVARQDYYGTRKICWLSVKKGTIWGFMGPVAVILTLNLAALILAQYKASTISVKNDKVALIKRWLRVTAILFPVLGITWVFGFLYLGNHFQIAGYLFVIFNSFQGVCIFIFHCLLDKKARNMIVDSFRKRTSSIHTGSSATQKKLKEHFQNGVKPNSITPVESASDCTKAEKSFQIEKQSNQRNWFKWHKPWSFCFELPVTERGSKKEQNSAPQAVVVHWNSLQDKNCV